MPSPTPPGDVERLAEACCEHSLYWHHDERGCGYHGYAPEHRCPCLLTFDEALAAHDAEVAAQALREAADDYSINLTFTNGPGVRTWLLARADRVTGHTPQEPR